MKSRASDLVDLLATQWLLLGLAAIIGGCATYFSASPVPASYFQDSSFVGALGPYHFISRFYFALSLSQVAFGAGSALCAIGLWRRLPWSRVGAIVLCCCALLGSLTFGVICFVSARRDIDYLSVDDRLCSGLYVATSLGFYISTIVLLSGRRVRSKLCGAASVQQQPNHGVQRTGDAPFLSAQRPRPPLRGPVR